jgi:hypothetical protein
MGKNLAAESVTSTCLLTFRFHETFFR